MSLHPTVVVADDHAPTRAGVREALEGDGFDVVGEAANARAAIDLVLRTRPHVALLDIHMPGNGVAAAARVATAQPGTAVVMLTYSREDEDLFGALKAGAQGYLLKDMNPDRLGAALRGVLAGEASIPRGLAARVLDEFRATSGRAPLFRPRRPSGLTSREWEIMVLLRDGLTTEGVAQHLSISPATVRVHVSSVLKKLQARDRSTALRMLDDL
ncbi:MAG: response regulator [Actinomycetes bacterium]